VEHQHGEHNHQHVRYFGVHGWVQRSTDFVYVREMDEDNPAIKSGYRDTNQQFEDVVHPEKEETRADGQYETLGDRPRVHAESVIFE
jgi:hypothetical protein